MKIFTESEAVGERHSIPCGGLVRLNDGREVVKVKHSVRDQEMACERNSGERCVFIGGGPFCGIIRCAGAIYLEKQIYLQLKLLGEVE